MSYDPLELRLGVLEIFREAQAPIVDAIERNLMWRAFGVRRRVQDKRRADRIERRANPLAWHFVCLDRPFVCGCGRRYASAHALRLHTRITHGGAP